LRADLERSRSLLADMVETQNDGRPWTQQDLSTMHDRLNGKIAISWTEGDRNLEELAAVLKRSPQLVKKKVKLTNFRKAIDYWYCRDIGIVKESN
jgi:hypothetical protein